MDEELTAEGLRALFHYNPETGLFTRKTKTWPGSRIGEVMQGLRADGYIQLAICGRRWTAHRLAWLYMTGGWPDGVIDHINGDRADNRWSNLRDVSQSGNQQNRRGAQRNSSHGIAGVTRSGRPEKPWRAQIKLPGGPRVNLGNFATQEEAKAAYEAAKRVAHPYSQVNKS